MENEVLIERAKAFVQAVAAQAPWAEIEPYYAPDVSQEVSQPASAQGHRSQSGGLARGERKGRKVIKAQTIEIVNAVSSGQCVVLEAIWTGTLAVGFGTLKPDDQLRARFAQIFEFKDGLIWRQRNYDCFEAW
jgi:hypothetical protein